jgi:hypothetical protein
MVEDTGVPGGNHRYVIRAENPFHTVQHIYCRELSYETERNVCLPYPSVAGRQTC